MTLTRAHELLIVATDGVWDAVTEAEAVNLVGNAATPADGCQQVLHRGYCWISRLHRILFGSIAAPSLTPGCLCHVRLPR